jgi:hypothetical protein
MEDDFNFEDFMEESNSAFEAKLEEYRERMMIEAIEQNYKQLEKNGLGEWHLRNMENDELVSLQQTLDIMLKHFEEDEDFEKCIVIKKELDKVTDAVKLDI